MPGQWTQFGWTWDNSADPGTFCTYQDGSLLDCDTSDRTTPGIRNMVVGQACSPNRAAEATDTWMGGIDKLTIYGEADGDLISTDWSNNAASYGR